MPPLCKIDLNISYISLYTLNRILNHLYKKSDKIHRIKRQNIYNNLNIIIITFYDNLMEVL